MPTLFKDFEDYTKASKSYDKAGRIPICVDRIISHLPNNCSLLDAGCGTGNYISPLIKSGKISKYTAIELNEGMLDIARSKSENLQSTIQIQFQKGDLLKRFNFDDDTFDAVIINQVLHHLTDIDKPSRKEQLQNVQHVFDECKRVLRNGGILCINTSSHAQSASLWYSNLLLPEEKMSIVFKRFPDVSEMKEMLLNARFTNIETEIDPEPMLGRSYFDYEKAFDASFRNAESTFAMVNSQELDDALQRLKNHLKDREGYDKKVRNDQEREGCSTEIFAI